MSLIEHCKDEFEYLEKHIPDHIVLEFKDEILNLIQKFADSGQSGGSAPYYIYHITDILKKLLSYEPITPVFNFPDDYTLIAYPDTGDDEIYQHKRLSSVFKRGVNGTPYYLDAIKFNVIDDEYVFHGTVEGITSHQYIKHFPFIPKTFDVDVRVEKNKAFTEERFIHNPEQLKEVFEYYDLFKS